MQRQLPFLLLASLFIIPLVLFAQPKIELISYASGLTRPVDIANCGDSRLFVVEQRGYIWILDSLGNKRPNPFLNIDPRVRSTANEQGLLGLAFPSDYADSGLFYVYYTRENDGDTRVSRFSVNPNDPDTADPDSEEILLTENQPYNNHNGGCIKFGPDGYLYIGLGDGGSGGDPQNFGQRKNTLLGKMLRIDVNSTSPGLPYGIPADNPFVNDADFRPEIWSWGLRNPWRFAFDPLTGDMWIGDVGQVTREEIDFEPAGLGGRNYGWRCYEGNLTYNTSNCPPASSFEAPIFDYDNNSIGCSVTGGMVYRGSKYSDLYGLYLFTDYCSGRWWATRQQPDGTFSTEELANLTNNQYASLGVDREGELYVAARNQGRIYKIEERCSSFQVAGTVTNATCHGTLDGIVDLDVTGGVGPYTISWSNDQTDTLIIYLDPGVYSVEVQDNQGCTRRDTFEVMANTLIQTPEISVTSWTAPLPDPVLICDSDTVFLEVPEAPAGMGYQWYLDGQPVANATSQQFATNQLGTYYAAYTGMPCNSPPSEPTVVEMAGSIVPVVEPAGNTILCGDEQTLLAVPAIPSGFGIQWLRNNEPIAGANSEQLIVTEAGNYAAQYLYADCDLEQSSAIVIFQSQAPMIIQENYYNLFVNGQFASIQWQMYNDDTQSWDDILGATDMQYVVTTEGMFTVVVTDFLGCTYQAVPIGVATTKLPESVTAFELAPNPSSGIVQMTLDLKRNEQIQLSLLDLQQRIVLSKSFQGQRIVEELDLSLLPAGTYYLQVQLESGIFVRPLVRN